MSAFDGFRAPTLRFLAELRQSNDKAWFEAHRTEYEQYYVAPALAFIRALGPRLRKLSKTINYEPKVNGSLFRIHRDVRFSKEKHPYKDHIDLWFWEGASKSWATPGFFFRLQPDAMILGTGLHRFDKTLLERYRQAVIDGRSGAGWRRTLDGVLSSGDYRLGAATRKKVPRGYDPAHPRADLLLHDGITVSWQSRVPRVARSSELVDWCEGHFRALLPVEKWLTKVAAP